MSSNPLLLHQYYWRYHVWCNESQYKYLTAENQQNLICYDICA